MKKKWWILIVLLLAGLGYLGYSRLSKSGAASAAPATQVTELVVVTRETLQDSVDGSGNLVAVQEVSLSFSSSGRVAEVLVKESENVAAGEPLLRLDTANLELNVAREKVALEEAQLRLEQTLAGATGDEIAAAEAGLSLAQANYSKVKEGTSSEQLAQLETDLQLRAQEVRKAQGNYDRYGEWMAGQLQDATLNYEQAQLAYDIAAAGPDSNDLWASWTQVESAQAKLDALLAGPTEEEVEAAKLKVEQAGLSLKKAQRQLAEATLTAPFAGTVVQLNVAEGELAGGTAVVVVSDLTTLDVDVILDENDVTLVQEGQPAQVSVMALDGPAIAGEIVAIAPTAQTKAGVSLYPVTVRLTSTDQAVRAGMTADVEIVTASWENVLTLPLRAIRIEGDESYVMLQTAEGEFKPRPVTLGVSAGGNVEIVTGLAEGDVVGVVTEVASEDETGTPGMGLLFRGRPVK